MLFLGGRGRNGKLAPWLFYGEGAASELPVCFSVYHPVMPDMSDWQAEVERHRLYLEARSHRNSFYEKLALLDGGTVALVITAVLGPLHGIVRHKYLLCVGLTFLVLAMLTLLRRNLLAVQFEFHAAASAAWNPAYTNNPAAKAQTDRLNKDIHYTELTGIFLSAIGIVLLLIEVWLILI